MTALAEKRGMPEAFGCSVGREAHNLIGYLELTWQPHGYDAQWAGDQGSQEALARLLEEALEAHEAQSGPS
jgi:hypothetical protein